MTGPVEVEQARLVYVPADEQSRWPPREQVPETVARRWGPEPVWRCTSKLVLGRRQRFVREQGDPLARVGSGQLILKPRPLTLLGIQPRAGELRVHREQSPVSNAQRPVISADDIKPAL